MVVFTSMHCPECGNPVEKNAQFCPKCYARIEPPTFWQKLLGLFRTTPKSRRPIITVKKNVTIKTTGKDGQILEYHSLNEVPPELRAQMESLQTEALKEALSSASADDEEIKFIKRKTVSLFKVKDASGNERVYHSLDELPPEIRKAWEQSQNEAEK